MLKGTRYRLKSSTLAIDMGATHHAAVTIPTGDEVTIISDSGPAERMVDVLWNGRKLTMFVIDLTQRGEELERK